MKTIKRRRRENKTDYYKRIELLKASSPRLTFRKTNKCLIAQYISSSEAKDKIEFGLDTRELLKHGWPKEKLGSLKSIPASYLLGILCGKKIKDKKMKTPILDWGMLISTHKTKPFAFLKGLVDSGLDISHKKETFPEEERIMGKSTKGINVKEIKFKIIGR